jgi:hypothetical protein
MGKNNSMVVVSGCPRSGTSLMMDCLRTSFGEDRIIGHKFPQIKFNEKLDLETESEFESRKYINSIINPDAEKDFQLTKDLNPNGFWECIYTVKGIKWHFNMPDLNKKFCKIVSQGLFNSNPCYISKVIFMLRDPRQVAKSQERLRRFSFASYSDEMNSDFLIHTPEMFITVTYSACKWILENPSVPIHVINYDDLVMNPDKVFSNLKYFLGEGDFSKNPINRKLRRSHSEVIKNDLWEYADTIYEFFKNGNYEKVIKYFERNSKFILKEKVTTFCTRLRQNVVYNQCLDCKSSCDLIKNFKKVSESRNIDWEKEPCMFDCLTGPFSEHISMEESIKKNHWL